MRKFWVFIFVVLLTGCNAWASIGTPIVTTTTWLNIPFEAMDTTTGVGRTPDSVSVIVWYGNCVNAGIFQISSASLDSNWWDSTQTGAGVGSKIYYFREVIADIDADSGAGLYSGVINAWFQGYPTPRTFSFNLLDDDLNQTLQLLRSDSAKHIYMTPGGNGANDGSTWATSVCSLRTAEALCTGASSYVIHIASGEYTAQCCTTELDYLKIEGSGMDRCRLTGVDTELMLKADGVKGIEVTGLHFTYAEGEGGTAIYLVNTSGFSIHHCSFQNVTSGVYMGTNCDYGFVYNNIMIDAGADGIYVNGDYNWICNNVIDSVSATGSDAIALAQASKHNIISGNIIRARVGSGIRSLGDWSDNYIVGNFVHSDEGKAYVGAIDDSKNSYVGNWEKCQIDTLYKTIQQDILNSPRSANSDSGYTAGRASNLDNLDGAVSDVEDQLSAIGAFIGALPGDSTYQVFFPKDGLGNKDSVQVYNAAETHVGTVIFWHTGATIDSATFRKH